ncbi:MAG: tetratricopeptide repeat protein [Candidatus Polarisedimenticolia bacterium]
MLPSSAAMACLTALLLAGAPADPSPSSSSSPSRAAVEQARARLRSGNDSGALASIDDALRIEPENADALMLLGDIMRGRERREEAEAAYRRAAELLGDTTPAGLDASCALADILTQQGRSGEAIAVLRRVQAAAPKRSSVQHDLGRILLVVGELQAAERAFLGELELQTAWGAPGQVRETIVASTREGLGVVRYRLGNDAGAIEALSHAPGSIEARYHAGLALSRLGRHQEALTALRDVLARDPQHRGALQAVARAAGAAGLSEEKQDALARFGELYKQDEAARALHVRVFELRTQADTLAKKGDSREAAARLEEAVRLAPDDLDLLLLLGRVQYGAQNPAAAEQTFRRILEKEPLQAEALHRLGRLLAERGDVPAAMALMESACGASPLNISYRVHLAQTYLRAGRPEDGVRELRLARRLAPADPESAYNLGLGLAQAGSLREAATELEESVRQGYTDPMVHQVLAQIYERLGDAEASRRAKQTYEKLRGTPPR